MSSDRKIKLFRCGQFLGWRLRSTIEALYARGLVTLERNGKGYIVAAHEQQIVIERPEENLQPNSATSGILQATHYSFEDGAIEGRPWDLKRLNGKRAGLNYAPPELQPIFLRVVLDCLA